MKLSYRQERQLRQIDATVCRSDPHLGAMFGMFDRLYTGQDLPGPEQLPDQPADRAASGEPPPGSRRRSPPRP